MSNSGRKVATVTFFGLMLISVGILWLLHNTGVLDLPIRVWWPFILIAVGLLHLFRLQRIFDFFGWLMLGLGTIFLLTANDIVDKEEAWKYWPVLLVVLGLTIIFQRGGGCSADFRCRIDHTETEEVQGDGKEMPSSNDDHVSESTIFGSINKKINSKNFKGGTISVIFGGAEIDLRAAELSEEGAVLDVSAIFGGVELRLPDSWVVQTRTSAILGGVDSKYSNTEDSQGKRLVINASAIFGGVEIEN